MTQKKQTRLFLKWMQWYSPLPRSGFYSSWSNDLKIRTTKFGHCFPIWLCDSQNWTRIKALQRKNFSPVDRLQVIKLNKFRPKMSLTQKLKQAQQTQTITVVQEDHHFSLRKKKFLQKRKRSFLRNPPPKQATLHKSSFCAIVLK